MPKKNKNNDFPTPEDEIDYDFLADEIGGHVLAKKDTVKWWIDTGILALNYLCSGKFIGGGIPSSKMIQILGNSSSCKTLFALNILHGVQKAGGLAVFLDAENTLSKEFAEKAAHVDPNKVLVIPVDKIPTIEKAFKAIQTIIKRTAEKYGKTKPIVIVYDSLSASPSEREFADTKVEEGMSKAKIKELGAGTRKPGERALICSEELRKLNPLLEEANCSVVFINQLRQKIGVMFGKDTTPGGGGKSLEYYCSLIIETRAFKRLKDKLENVIGMQVSASNEKNKCFRPFVSAKDMHLFFDKGVNPFGGLLDLLIKTERITTSGAGNYRVLEPYANGEEITFKSSKERNDVPPEVLLKCPALVDATDASQIQRYLDDFGIALDAVSNDIAAAEEVEEENSMDG